MIFLWVLLRISQFGKGPAVENAVRLIKRRLIIPDYHHTIGMRPEFRRFSSKLLVIEVALVSTETIA